MTQIRPFKAIRYNTENDRDISTVVAPPYDVIGARLRDELSAVTDPTPIIFEYALEESVDICQATLELFLTILGSEAGNLVLQTLATGGVYLAGGIPPRIIPQLRGKRFLDAFARKGRLSNMLMSVPVDVITNSKAALFGAANHALLNADK